MAKHCAEVMSTQVLVRLVWRRQAKKSLMIVEIIKMQSYGMNFAKFTTRFRI
jgi:DhnA family fructose-bisphosphate aldolase class Ia